MSCFVRKFLKCSGFVFVLWQPLLGLAQQVPMASDSLSRGEVETWLRTGASQEGVKRIGAVGNSRAVGDDSVSGHGQRKLLSDWEKEWMQLQQHNDAEKNFRLPAFLDFLAAWRPSPWTEVGAGALPVDWVSTYSPDNALWVAAGILRYQNDNDRLLWVVAAREQPGALLVFDKKLNFSSTPTQALSLRLGAADQASDLLLMQLQLGEHLVLDLPDLYLRLFTARLVAADKDADREKFNQQLLARMALLLGREELFAHPFSDYEQLSVLLSPDEQLKVVTWNVEGEDFYNRFYGFVSLRVKDKIRVIRLNDQYRTINHPETTALNPNRWYGAVYYELLEHKYRGSVYYTLLGYNAHGPFSKIRVVETLEITNGGQARFGVQMIEVDGRLRRRLVYEYSQRANMLLRYDAQQAMIVMDNLAPSEQYLQNDFRYYGPDFTHNALRFDKGKWLYLPDVDLRNPAVGRQRRN